MQFLFGVRGEVDFVRVRSHCTQATHKPILRVFYYDSIDDVRRDGESDCDYQSRIEQQDAFLRSIQRLDGFFVRLGSVTGRRPSKLRQKEVDVLLAVDMLEHSFRKNMDVAFLLAGDRDFAPLVESVVRLGTRVQIFYDPRSASQQLCDAADSALALTVDDLWGWSTSHSVWRTQSRKKGGTAAMPTLHQGQFYARALLARPPCSSGAIMPGSSPSRCFWTVSPRSAIAKTRPS